MGLQCIIRILITLKAGLDVHTKELGLLNIQGERATRLKPLDSWEPLSIYKCKKSLVPLPGSNGMSLFGYS